MPLQPSRMKVIQSKMKELDWPQHVPMINHLGFFQTLKVDKNAVRGWIWPNFEIIQDFMVDLMTCKKNEDQIQNECPRVVTSIVQTLNSS